MSESKIIYPIGYKYKEWTVIGDEYKIGRIRYIPCEHSCGLKRNINKQQFLKNRPTLCDCEKKKVSIGDKFGKLTVISESVKKKSSNSEKILKSWICQCECGNKANVINYELLCGKVVSCGCYRKTDLVDKMHKANKKYNDYEFKDDYIIGYTTNTNEPFLVDIDIYEKIKEHAWHKNSDGYISTNIFKDGKVNVIKLHHLIIPQKQGYVIDHINRNRLDNRKNNLRYVTQQQNTWNSSSFKSKVRGVHKSKKKWRAVIQNKTIGCYDTIEEAIRSRLIAEKDIYGDYSSQKDLFYLIELTDEEIKEWLERNTEGEIMNED